jgi:hypothetical protein
MTPPNYGFHVADANCATNYENFEKDAHDGCEETG